MRILLLLAACFGHSAEVFDISCEGYHSAGVDWGELRRTFEIYADKYLDRPQFLAKELALAGDYGLGYHDDNRCTLGDLCLRFLLWLAVDPGQLRATVSALAAGQQPADTLGQVVQETYTVFWNIGISWSEIHRSEWPVFSILAAVAERLRDDSQDPCVPESYLEPFVESFDNAIMASADKSLAVLLEAGHCQDAVASALLSLADSFRTTRWQQDRNRYYQFTATGAESQPPEQDAEQILARVEAMLHKSPLSWRLLTSRWPVWRLLDRLGAAEVAKVSTQRSSFLMFVFPHRVRSDGLISNRIRATSQAYCHQLFQDEVLRIASAAPKKRIRVVEAGPHIGDCMLWAAAEFGDRVQATAIEPVGQVVSLFRRSIFANGFEDRIDLHHAFCGSESSQPVGRGAHATNISAILATPWLSIDSLVEEDVDVLKIHTNGGERQILDGASSLFEKHKVHVVIVHSAEAHQLWPSAEFLLARGYEVTADGRILTLSEESWLRSRVEEKGGLQLHARRGSA